MLPSQSHGTTSTPRPPPHPRPPPPPSHASAAGQGVAPPLPSGIASPQGGPRVGARLRGVCAAPRPLRALGLPTGRAWRSVGARVGGPLGGAAPSTSENWGASPATSDSNQHTASFPPFELAAGDVQFEFGEVVSAPFCAAASRGRRRPEI